MAILRLDALKAILILAITQLMGCGESIAPPEARTGGVEIRVRTVGATIDLDPDGYTVSIDGLPTAAIGTNNAVTISTLLTGKHNVGLGSLAQNCVVIGSEARSVIVKAGEVPVHLSFDVSCRPLIETPPGPWDY